jgi:hypothetical protein
MPPNSPARPDSEIENQQSLALKSFFKKRKGQHPNTREELMQENKVVIFKPYPFEIGQKIHIDGGPRKGDWEVIGISDRKIKLRCPISFKEFEWNRFCYFAQERTNIQWPRED